MGMCVFEIVTITKAKKNYSKLVGLHMQRCILLILFDGEVPTSKDIAVDTNIHEANSHLN